MGLKDQVEFESDVFFDENGDEVHDTTAAASATAASAIAKAASTAVGAPAPKMKLAFADKCSVFDQSTVEGLALSAPRIKGEQGSLFAGNEDLGEEITVEIVSFNYRWAIGDGADNAESKKNFRVSYDDKTITKDGSLISDYIASLKAQGFNKASKSPYMDIWVLLRGSKKSGPVADDEIKLCNLQCSQTSMGAFISFATTRGLLESKGIAKPLDLVGVRAMKRTSGSNKYTNFEFFVPKA
jgi:hypothetical protein